MKKLIIMAAAISLVSCKKDSTTSADTSAQNTVVTTDNSVSPISENDSERVNPDELITKLSSQQKVESSVLENLLPAEVDGLKKTNIPSGSLPGSVTGASYVDMSGASAGNMKMYNLGIIDGAGSEANAKQVANVLKQYYGISTELTAEEKAQLEEAKKNLDPAMVTEMEKAMKDAKHSSTNTLINGMPSVVGSTEMRGMKGNSVTSVYKNRYLITAMGLGGSSEEVLKQAIEKMDLSSLP